MELFSDNIKEIATNIGNNPMGIRSGIDSLDNAIRGFRPANLILVGGRSSHGKTSIALDFALNAPSCMFFSLEMSKQQLKERALCSLANLNHHRITLGKMQPGDKDKLLAASEILSGKKIMLEDEINTIYPSDYPIIYKGKEIPTNSINSLIEKVPKYDLGLIIIDYLQLIRFGMWTEREDIRLHKITWELHNISKRLNIPIILLSQLRRFETDRYYESKKKVSPIPRLDDLRDSGAIEQDSDIVLLLHRPRMYDEKMEINLYEDVVEDDAQIIIAKSRNGPTGSLNVPFHCGSMSWINRGSSYESGEI